MKEDIEKIKNWWAKVDPGCDDPEDVASRGLDDVPLLIKALEEALLEATIYGAALELAALSVCTYGTDSYSPCNQNDCASCIARKALSRTGG